MALEVATAEYSQARVILDVLSAVPERDTLGRLSPLCDSELLLFVAGLPRFSQPHTSRIHCAILTFRCALSVSHGWLSIFDGFGRCASSLVRL